ncbi:hypothetical protein MP638_004884 [Amoeboaphelidium occidentale]|nr:hypothetical protein MP638_004884 [Amoeboaphelidium occidentale]
MQQQEPSAPPGTRPVPNDIENQIKSRLSQFIEIAHRRFPGAQPVSFLKEHLDSLKQESYFVSEKSDGTRYLMYIMLNESENPIKQECYLIDRKNKYYSVDLSFYNAQSQLLNDTLIDGELVMDRDGTAEIWRFLAFDLLMVNGEMKVDRNLEKRLGALYEFVVKPYNKHLKQCLPEYVQSRPFTIEMKKVEKCYHLKEILASIKSLKHENDGLLFTSVDRPYDFGTCDSMLKWKPSSHNSVDFKIRVQYPQTDDELPRFFLQISTGSRKYQDYGELVLDSSQKALKLQFLNNPPDGRIVECTYDEFYPTKWRFMRFREDKNEPNFVNVVDNIMKSIHEAVPVEMVRYTLIMA